MQVSVLVTPEGDSQRNKVCACLDNVHEAACETPVFAPLLRLSDTIQIAKPNCWLLREIATRYLHDSLSSCQKDYGTETSVFPKCSAYEIKGCKWESGRRKVSWGEVLGFIAIGLVPAAGHRWSDREARNSSAVKIRKSKKGQPLSSFEV